MMSLIECASWMKATCPPQPCAKEDDAPAYAKATARSTTSVLCIWGTSTSAEATVDKQEDSLYLSSEALCEGGCTRSNYSYGTLDDSRSLALQQKEGRA